MKILGIETSCDETAAAVVKDGREVLSSVIASSQDLHRKYGGIVPEVAAREQVRVIIPVVDEAIKQAELVLKEVDAFAVTYGPGLIGSLLVGIETAKALAWVLNKPLFRVNHLLAHVYSIFLPKTQIDFPFVALIVSGGHTDLLLMHSHTQYEWLGGTRDDAAGEAFDKAARLMGLGYPGGPAIAKAAEGVKESSYAFRLPRPMINSPDFDFSFSGLKTAVRKLLEENKQLPAAPVAFEFQEAVAEVLVKKTILAGKKYNVSGIALCGGVSANKVLREKLRKEAEKEGMRLFVPSLEYCTDNAAMVSARAYFAPNLVARVEELTPQAGLGY